jgi:hypothetical protein
MTAQDLLTAGELVDVSKARANSDHFLFEQRQ